MDSRFVLKEIFRLRKPPLRLLRRQEVIFVNVVRSRAGARDMPVEEDQRFRNAERRSHIHMHCAAVEQITGSENQRLTLAGNPPVIDRKTDTRGFKYVLPHPASPEGIKHHAAEVVKS